MDTGSRTQGNAAGSEPLTEELLARLLASATPEAYLAEAQTDDRSLADYLYDLIEARGLSRAEAIRASSINSTFGYQVFNGERHVGRNNAIKLAFGCRCTLR